MIDNDRGGECLVYVAIHIYLSIFLIDMNTGRLGIIAPKSPRQSSSTHNNNRLPVSNHLIFVILRVSSVSSYAGILSRHSEPEGNCGHLFEAATTLDKNAQQQNTIDIQRLAIGFEAMGVS